MNGDMRCETKPKKLKDLVYVGFMIVLSIESLFNHLLDFGGLERSFGGA